MKSGCACECCACASRGGGHGHVVAAGEPSLETGGLNLDKDDENNIS